MQPGFRDRLSNDYERVKADTSYEYLVLVVQLPNAPAPEIIINPRVNFEGKVNYYLETYGDDGEMVKNPIIKVIDYCFARDIEEATQFAYNFS